MLKPGMVIGDRYEIIELVGTGGMSDVYKARCHKLNRYVAIKVLKSEFNDDYDFLRKFGVEAQSAAGLSHPNIVNVYDVGEEDGIYYIVMELVEGITLKEYIREHGRLDVKEAVDFAIQIAAGLDAAHLKHIVHRDIKPQNIIVSTSGILKVTDFGIAKAASSNTVVTNNAVGSVHYISPEQARGGFCDEKSDIYSLGITMYEMVTGRVPFQGDNNVSVALQHIQGDMIAPRDYYPDILPSMEKVILKCTNKKPELRYLTANALTADLRQIMSDPEGHFVTKHSIMDDSPTLMMSPGEVNQIKSGKVSGIERGDSGGRPNIKENIKAMNTNKEDELEEDEIENEGKMDPKLEKLVLVLGIAAAILVCMFVIFVIGKSLKLFTPSPKSTTETTESTLDNGTTAALGTTVIVPSMVGDTLELAQQKLTTLGLQFKIIEIDSSEVKNSVIQQSAVAGEAVTKDTVIELTVSKGPELITVPNVIGYDLDQVKQMLEAESLNLKPVYDYDDTVEKGLSISAKPGSGSEVPPNSTVSVVFSRGPKEEKVSVPDFVNMTADHAKDLASENNLILKVLEEESDTVPLGNIIRQSPNKDSMVSPRSTITVYVSKGKKQVNTTYYGEVKISSSDSPLFDGEEGEISLHLVQKGVSREIYNEVVTNDDFPIRQSFTSETGGDATIIMYLNGEKVDGSWSITLTAGND